MVLRNVIEVDYEDLLSHLRNGRYQTFHDLYINTSRWLRNNNFSGNNWHTLYVIKMSSELDKDFDVLKQNLG